MKSIIYICPTGSNKPVGGIKIIYRHVEILSKLLPREVDSKIFHFEDINFKCNWFTHKVNFKKSSTFNSNKELNSSVNNKYFNLYLLQGVLNIVKKFFTEKFNRKLSNI